VLRSARDLQKEPNQPEVLPVMHDVADAKPVLDKVLRDEADFANQDYAPWANDLEINRDMFRRYQLPSNLSEWRQMSALMMGDVAGKSLLDFGCGMGEESIYFARLGARVTSIDISEVGIATLKKRAAHHQLDIRAYEMRGDPTSFDHNSFDIVHGLGILHHLGIEQGLAEVRRILRPGGIGVFLEPMGNSRTIEAVKTWLMTHARSVGTFDHVTDHEHNLTWAEVRSATRQFSEAITFPYHLLYRLKRIFPKAVWPAIQRFDASMLTLAPPLRHFCGGVAMRVRK
jgi:2-polyprenyl-3-methyl-5-hydroxy-6-metoxy-1,4-benzoquinol methylase